MKLTDQPTGQINRKVQSSGVGALVGVACGWVVARVFDVDPDTASIVGNTLGDLLMGLGGTVGALVSGYYTRERE